MKLIDLLMFINETAKDIGSSQPMICGGLPRDRYLNLLNRISDIDITTGDKTIYYLAQEIELRLKKKYAILKKDMNDGHVSIFMGKLKIDFSSNFIINNINDYLIKLNIDNPTDMEKEIFSRDFTCNSLLMSLDFKDIYDPTNRGIADIDNKTIKTCLSPEVTLTSNKNRVIRSIYLACKLGFNIDESIIEFVQHNPETVKISSKKSLIKKLNESFYWDSDKAYLFLTMMNLWNHIPISKEIYPYYMRYLKHGK